MANFDFTKTELDGVYIVEPRVFADSRGHFMETYSFREYAEAGIDKVFVQDNQSRSMKGVLRGLHYQKSFPQGKLIRVVLGAIFDVAVDMRSDSPDFLKWFGIQLSAENHLQLYIPPGFAHGFLVLSPEAEVVYKCTDYYHPEDEGGLVWDDPDIGIKWPLDEIGYPILSGKDSCYPRWRDR